MTDKAQILADVSRLLSIGDTMAAKTFLRERYPFKPLTTQRSNPGRARSMRIFLRDSFTDRYSGERLVFPGALLLLSQLLPKDFPTHPNWRTDVTHFAYYELWPVLDHIQPITRGGSNDDDNLATTSALRNSAKANFTLEELGWSLRTPPAPDAGWDGLTSWFFDTVQTDPRLLVDGATAKWHAAALAAGLPSPSAAISWADGACTSLAAAGTDANQCTLNVPTTTDHHPTDCHACRAGPHERRR